MSTVISNNDTREDEMIKRAIKSILSFTLILALCMLVTMFAAGSGMSSDYAEETPDTVLPDDQVISGTMDDFSEHLIYVDGIGYRFCDRIKVFNPRNKMITVENLEAAVEVKLFNSNGCVRKLKVVRYAQ